MRRLVAGAALGALLGIFAGRSGLLPPLRSPGAEQLPMPYQSPLVPGGISLRLAMVHDVLHERYPRHGAAWYEERNRSVLAALAAETEGSETWLALLDDLGAGLDRLGRPAEAVEVLRRKLARQESAGSSADARYATYANLGTFLVHDALAGVRSGDAVAAARLAEGLDSLRRAIEIEPGAHFGREVWQIVAVEFLLAASRDRTVLTRFDLVGNLLEAAPAWRGDESRRNWRAATPEFELLAARGQPPAPGRNGRFIHHVGAEGDWQTRVPSRHRAPVPFDEPMLGILGMWRLGGGPNPHFALALAGIAERIGQRRIAWAAYERAIEMKDAFWPEAAVAEALADHCRRRQEVLEASLGEDCRARHVAEFAHGREYQRAYETYEAERIAAGASVDDPTFHDEFESTHGRIASPPGDADWIEVERRPSELARIVPAAFVCAGLLALAATFSGRR